MSFIPNWWNPLLFLGVASSFIQASLYAPSELFDITASKFDIHCHSPSVFSCCYDILQFSTLSGCCLPPHYRQTFRYCNFVFAKRGDNNSSSWHLVAKCLESFQVKMPYVASVKQRWHEIYEESRVVLAKLCSEDIIHFCRFLFVCCL